MVLFPTGHTSSQKSKIKKRAHSGMNRAKETGEICNTFVAYVYWDFDRGTFEGSGHLPEGMDVPDINKLLWEIFKQKAIGEHTKGRPLRLTLRSTVKTRDQIVVEPTQHDESSHRDAEPNNYEDCNALTVDIRQCDENMRDVNHDCMGSEGELSFDAHGGSISPGSEGMLCGDLQSGDSLLKEAEYSDFHGCSIGSTELLDIRTGDAGVALDVVTVTSPKVAMGQDLYSDTWGGWAESATVIGKEYVREEIKKLFERGNIW